MSDRVAIVVVAAVTALLTLPFLLSPYLIAQDLPAHVETAAQIVDLLRGDDVIAAMYRLHTLPWPNSLPTFLIAAALPLIGGLAAAKLVTAIFVVAWPTSLALLFLRLRRSPWLALLTIPTCFDLSFSYGFVHFVVGKPVWALAFVAVIDLVGTFPHPPLKRFTRRQNRNAGFLASLIDLVTAPTRRRAAAVVVAFVVLFHCHLLLFASAVPLGVIVALVMAPSWRARGVGVGAVVVGALPGLWWIAQKPVVSGSSTYPELSKRIAQFWSNLGDLHPGRLDEAPWWIAAVGFVVIAVVAVVGRDARARWATRETIVAVVLFAACAGFACFGPIRTPDASVIAERFAAVAAALVVGIVPVVVGPRLRAVLIATGLVCAGIMAVDATRQWRGFSREQMGDFDQVLAAVPPGSRVATHFTRPTTTWGRHNNLWHWPKLVAERGSRTDDSFAWRDTCVLGLRPGVVPPKHPTLSASSLSSWDFLLVQGGTPGLDRSLQRASLTLVTSSGAWRLFRPASQAQ